MAARRKAMVSEIGRFSETFTELKLAPLPYWPMPAEENPFLGVRGIRLSLQAPQLLETQLRALFASADGRALRIMFPMVGQVEEWRAARDMALRLREEIPVADLQLGIMIEVPSAALLAPVLAREVDFFSLGTNDLIQYSLAVDRVNENVANLYQPLHLAVLRLIDQTVKAGHNVGNKWVGVCGEMASEPDLVPILVGLGVDELSVAPGAVPRVKEVIRSNSYEDCLQLTRDVMNASGVAAAQRILRLFSGQHIPPRTALTN